MLRVSLTILILSICLHLTFSEVPTGDISSTITDYDAVTSSLEGFSRKYFNIPAEKKGRTISISVLDPNDTIRVYLSNEYRQYPDRNHTFTFISQLVWQGTVEEGDTEGTGRYALDIPKYEGETYDVNTTMEIRIDKVRCALPGNTSCTFSMVLLPDEPPVLEIMLGVLGGIAGFAIYVVCMFTCLFCCRDCVARRIEKRKRKKKAAFAKRRMIDFDNIAPADPVNYLPENFDQMEDYIDDEAAQNHDENNEVSLHASNPEVPVRHSRTDFYNIQNDSNHPSEPPEAATSSDNQLLSDVPARFHQVNSTPSYGQHPPMSDSHVV